MQKQKRNTHTPKSTSEVKWQNSSKQFLVIKTLLFGNVSCLKVHSFINHCFSSSITASSCLVGWIQRCKYTKDMIPVHHRAPYTHTHPKGQFILVIPSTSMSLNGLSKPENPEQHGSTGEPWSCPVWSLNSLKVSHSLPVLQYDSRQCCRTKMC